MNYQRILRLALKKWGKQIKLLQIEQIDFPVYDSASKMIWWPFMVGKIKTLNDAEVFIVEGVGRSWHEAASDAGLIEDKSISLEKEMDAKQGKLERLRENSIKIYVPRLTTSYGAKFAELVKKYDPMWKEAKLRSAGSKMFVQKDSSTHGLFKKIVIEAKGWSKKASERPKALR